MVSKKHSTIFIIALTFSLMTSVILLFLYKKNNSYMVAKHIYSILEQHRITFDIDQCSISQGIQQKPEHAQGVEAFIQQINTFVSHKTPLAFLVVGFPFKSKNIEKKVISTSADMAERKSLEYLNTIFQDISRIYEPGAHITIFCDGTFFGEFFDVTDDEISTYEATLKKLSQDLAYITLITTQDMSHMILYNVDLKNAQKTMRNIVDSYPPNNDDFITSIEYNLPETLKQRILLEFDYQEGKKIIQKKSVKDIAVKLMARQSRMRKFLDEIFSHNSIYGNHIRLTLHFSKYIDKKFGIRLSPDSCITPYHGTLVEEKNNKWSIKFKKDIDTNKYQQTSKIINGIPCAYFKAI